MTSYTLFAVVAACVLPAAPCLAGILNFSFTNTGSIAIPDVSNANPYPSTINVSGIPAGQLLNVQVLLNGVSHAYPDDMAAAVVAPSGSAAILFGGPGYSTPAANLNWIFDDNAALPLPIGGALSSGSFRPGLNEYGATFSAPGPGTTYALNFSAWLNQNPNGAWNLYVIDANGGDAGNISGGWAVQFTVADGVPEPSSFALGLAGLGLVWAVGRRRG